MTTSEFNGLKRQFEKIIARKQDILLAHRTNDRTSAWQNVYYANPSYTQIIGFGKRLAALKPVEPALYALLQPILVEATDMASKCSDAKIQLDNARLAKKQAQADKVADKAATRKDPFRQLNAEVANILRQVAEPYRKEAYASSEERQNSFIQLIKGTAAKCGSFSPSTMFPTHAKGMTQWDYMAACRNHQEAYKYVEQMEGTWQLKSRSVLDAVVIKLATEFAEDMVVAFVTKVGMKLSGIVDRKGNLGKASIHGSLRDHWMTFEFRDGSTFQVQSQIVWKTSINGLHFPQFPTCFRNVKLADGSKLELPSEAKMKEKFA